MSHEIAELKEYPVRRLDVMPRAVMLGAGVLVALGLIGFVIALVTDADRAWRAYLFNWIYFAGVAQGAVVLGAVVTLTRGVWSRPIRRVAIAFVAFLPIAYLILFPPLLIFADHILPWLHKDVGDKALYLNMPFLVARHLIFLGAVLVTSLLFAYWQLRPDAGRARDAGWRGLDWLTRGWQAQAIEEERAYRKLATLSVFLVLSFVFAYTFVAWDFVMSLDPYWLSMLIGPYLFMAAFLGGLAATAVATLIFRDRLGLQAYVEGANLHDLGKLLFGFCIFWAYLFWSQYIVIWYGNLPHEQIFLIHRFHPPYLTLSLVVLFCLFVLPFAGLLGAKPKRTPVILGFFAGVVLFGLWLERYLLIYPTLYPGADRAAFGITEVAPGLLMLGLVIGSLAWFATRFPMLQVWHPANELELLGVEVDDTQPR